MEEGLTVFYETILGEIRRSEITSTANRQRGAALLHRRPNQSLRRRRGRRQLRLVVVRKRRRGPVSDGPCASATAGGFTRVLRGRSQYALKRRLPVAA